MWLELLCSLGIDARAELPAMLLLVWGGERQKAHMRTVSGGERANPPATRVNGSYGYSCAACKIRSIVIWLGVSV